MGRFAVIVPAAGKSTRFGDPRQKKIFADLNGRAVWLRSVEAFIHRADVAQVIVCVAADDRELFDRRYGAHAAFLQLSIVAGGLERVDSIAAAIDVLGPTCEFVAVHDAARPCVDAALIDRVFEAARTHGAAIPALPVSDTLKRVDADRRVTATVPREGLWAVQTPQAFRRDWFEAAYANRAAIAGVTDDASLVEALGHPVTVVDGAPTNLKITRSEDLTLAVGILKGRPSPAAPSPGHPFLDERTMWDTPPRPRDAF